MQTIKEISIWAQWAKTFIGGHWGWAVLFILVLFFISKKANDHRTYEQGKWKMALLIILVGGLVLFAFSGWSLYQELAHPQPQGPSLLD